jgi:hypothetical protein
MTADDDLSRYVLGLSPEPSTIPRHPISRLFPRFLFGLRKRAVVLVVERRRNNGNGR